MSTPNAIAREPELRFLYATQVALYLDADTSLANPEIGDAQMSVLCRKDMKPDKVRKILKRIEGTEVYQRDRYRDAEKVTILSASKNDLLVDSVFTDKALRSLEINADFI